MGLCILAIKVTPGAKKARWARSDDGMVKCYVTAPAVDGKANEAVIEALSSRLGISKRSIRIVTGHTTRIKRIEITSGFDHDAIMRQLGVADIQVSLF